MVDGSSSVRFYCAFDCPSIGTLTTSTVDEVLSDVVANEKLLASVEVEDELIALPAITRPEVESDAKLLLVPNSQEPLRGYRGFRH